MNLYQRSDEWHTARIGKISASRVAGLSAKPKTGKALNATLLEILAERLTGTKQEIYVNKAMQWGIDNEAGAISAYENLTGEFVVGCGFIEHPTIPMSGASPDGLIGDDGLIEIKCPESTTHLNTLMTQQVPSEYLAQITWQLACTARKWCDFVSYDPRMPEHLQLCVIRVQADDVDITALEKLVTQSNSKLNKVIKEMSNGRCQ